MAIGFVPDRFDWTDERVNTLKALWGKGFSASEIAREMGCGSRSAIIGKVHRLNLAPRGKQMSVRKPAYTPRPRKEPRVHIRIPQRSKPDRDGLNAQQRQDQAAALRERFATETGPASGGVTFADLEPFHCRWPMGDPSDLETFRFCGEPKEGEGPYCTCHRRMGTKAWMEAAE
jgi:GcrA cell cycle regulator